MTMVYRPVLRSAPKDRPRFPTEVGTRKVKANTQNVLKVASSVAVVVPSFSRLFTL